MDILKNPSRLIDMVNPFMGSADGGNCLVGPYRPFGMVRLGPDSPFPQSENGYRPGQPIIRFSHTHVSGTGGPSRYGNIGITPFIGKPETRNIPPFVRAPLERIIDGIPNEESSAVGYYRVNMRPWDVKCELTTTQHVGIHRYSFPAGKEPHILLDAAACITRGDTFPGYGDVAQSWDSTQGSTGGWLQIVSDNEIIGRSDFRGGWGHDKSYSIYYYLKSDATFVETILSSEGGMVPSGEGREVIGKGIRCVIKYPNVDVLNLQIGISFVSVASARGHVEQEAKCKTFDEIRKEAETEWELLLSTFKIEGGTKQEQDIFYSMLYRLFCMPTDLGVDEENPYWKSGVRQFTDYYCLWDSVRNANSFFHLFFPILSADMMNSLLDIADHIGWLPDAYISNQHAYMQSACACDILFPEAARKKINGVNYEKALKYLRKNNEVETPDVLVKGRYKDEYNKLGYLSTNISKGSVSRHIEYTYHDWCIAKLAGIFGDKETEKQYLENSKRIWNLWNDETKTFFPRSAEGEWVKDYNPWKEPKEAWNDPYCYEGSTAVWSFNVFQDFYGLIDRVGGNEEFISLLNRVFEEGLFHIKETRMHLPHLYTYAGRPDLAADKVLENLSQFSIRADGLPDNEDMGCQSGYFLWQAMGLYPIYGQEHYMLTPPIFNRMEAKINEDCTLIITAERNGLGKYIQECVLGNENIDRAWVTHAEVLRARRIHFVLTDIESDWGKNCPPPNH